MTYFEILHELNKLNLKDKFISEFESYVSSDFLNWVKKTDKIKGVGSLLKILLQKFPIDSEPLI